MQEYKILQSDSTHGLEMLVKEAINAGEMQLYGEASEFGGRKCQVVVKGIASPGTPSLPGGNDTPEAVLLRIATAEMKAAQAALTASEAKGAAEVAAANLAVITLEVSRKADLVSGKVPYDQLPEFPVGRKVNVPDKAARLALTNYTDLTIAYQSDTGDAWGLDANADATVEANWSRLGNAQAVGVQSFNGRTGNIGPQPGDYITSMIPEALGKRYVTEEQITAWTAKAGPAEITSAINQALAGGDLPFETKQHAADTYVAKATRGVANGVAPLGVDNKIPAIHLPTQTGGGEMVVPVTTYTNVEGIRSALTWYKNSGQYDRRVRIVTNLLVGKEASFIHLLDPQSNLYVIQSADPANNVVYSQIIEAIVPAGWSYQVVLATVTKRTIAQWLELDTKAGSTFTPVSEKAKANGVAPLDANGRVPLINLPGGLPLVPRQWRDVKASRAIGTWVTNSSGNEMQVYLRSDQSTAATRYIQAVIRRDATDNAGLTFSSDATAATSNRRHTLILTIPAGWQYIVVSDGGTTIAATQYWYEMS